MARELWDEAVDALIGAEVIGFSVTKAEDGDFVVIYLKSGGGIGIASRPERDKTLPFERGSHLTMGFDPDAKMDVE